MPSCSQPNCRVEETGVCLEGHTGECPHWRDTEVGFEAQAVEIQTPSEVVFHTGEKLTVDDATFVLQERGARVIFAAGGSDSGKTTFLARIGELFRTGNFPQCRFSGSLTLWAFERATWKATVPSGGGVPSTERTLRVENDMFYHLAVQQGHPPARRVDLLISDLAGETFPTILGSAEFARGLNALGRCDTLILFLDCARLAKRGEQHAEWDNAIGFLQRAYPRNLSVRAVNLQVVFSRWDYVESADVADSHITFCLKVENDLKQDSATAFPRSPFIVLRRDQKSILARPATTKFRKCSLLGVRCRPLRYCRRSYDPVRQLATSLCSTSNERKL